jgi:hypothetical protein
MSNTSGGSFAGGSLLSNGGQRAFDMRNESDVIELLKIVHQNQIDPAIKNNLRDLIFAYRQNMSDQDLEKVRQGFIPLGIQIQHNTVAATTNSVSLQTESVLSGVGAARRTPSFAVPPVSVHATVVSDPVPVAAPAPVQTSAPINAPVVPPALTQTVPEVLRVAQPAVTPASASASSTYADPSERIKEIKRLVNEKVGNPVNLIDTHNELGREYMSALLDAMKKSNGASADEVNTAMARLEKAFAEVNAVVTEVMPEAIAAQEQQTVRLAVKEVTPAVPVPTPPVIAQAEVETPKEEIIEVPLINRDAIPMSVAAEKEASLNPLSKMSSLRDRLQTPAVAATDPVSTPSYIERVSPWAEQQTTSAPVPVSPASSQTTAQTGIHSVAKDKQLQELLRSTRQKEVEAKLEIEETKIAAMDPLFAPDVTSGLNQLLSEWNLFKNSGLFGTGPSGAEHPLYKKIGQLTMAAVIAGRFEGATAPIKQSITDYMNGWRYEEGIVHEHGETFEHYLRRVVRHILSKQKNK